MSDLVKVEQMAVEVLRLIARHSLDQTRIEALEAAGKGLAEAVETFETFDTTMATIGQPNPAVFLTEPARLRSDLRAALAAWRAAELKALCNAPLDTDAPEGEAEFETWLNDDPTRREAEMRERTQAEIEAALTAYHGADGWDHNDRADMSYAIAAADAVAPRSTETELELVGSVETEVGEYPYSDRHSLRVLLGRAVSMIAPSLTQGQSMDEADRMLSSTIAAVRAIDAPASVSVPKEWKPIAVVQRDQPIQGSMKIDWVAFDPRGPLPPNRKYVLIQFSKISCYGVGPVAVGYLRYAAGDRHSPSFVVPGVKRTNDYHEPDVPREEMIVTHWADIFGDDFECPGWHGTRILTTAKS